MERRGIDRAWKGSCSFGTLNWTVRKAFPRYVGILEEERYPAFQVARRVPCGIGLGSATERLWAEHARLLSVFRGLRGRMDRGFSPGGPAEVSFLDLKLELAKRLLGSCCFCGRRCGVDRSRGERGECGAGRVARVASFQEGHSLSVLFAGCNFHCAFCREWEVSQLPGAGEEVSGAEIAKRISGHSGVEFSGGEPTPNLHVVLEALSLVERDLPVVWSSNMYLSGEAMTLLDGVVDLFVSGFKYGSNDTALGYSGVKDYFSVVARNQKIACAYAEMLVKVLFLPGGWARTDLPDIADWLAGNCGKNVLVSLMQDYSPGYKSKLFPGLSGKVGRREFEAGRKLLEARGIPVI